MARATGREEKASKFCVMREKRDVKARGCVTWLGEQLKDTSSHSRLDGVKAESVRWQTRSLLTTMGGKWYSITCDSNRSVGVTIIAI